MSKAAVTVYEYRTIEVRQPVTVFVTDPHDDAQIVAAIVDADTNNEYAEWETLDDTDSPVLAISRDSDYTDVIYERAIAYGPATRTSTATWRQCEACDSWFRVGKGNARITRRYCSDACRQRAHRARR